MKYKSLHIFISLTLWIVCVQSNSYAKTWGELTDQTYYYFNAGQYKEALEFVKEAIQIQGRENEPLSLTNLVVLYNVTGQQDLAKPYISKIQVLLDDAEERLLELEQEKAQKNFDDILSLRMSIAYYKNLLDSISKRKVFHSKSMMQSDTSHQPTEYVHRTYHEDGSVWKEYYYSDADLRGVKEFDQQGKLISDSVPAK